MDVIEAIRTRRSIPDVDPEPLPPRELIEEIIDCATWAPNHHLTEPWRFHVVAGAARLGFGDAMAHSREAVSERDPARLAAVRAKTLRAPVLIVVTAKPGRSGTETLENRDAVAAAIQNLLLAAHARGLGAMWRTGLAATSFEAGKWLGLEPAEIIVGVVYVGLPRSGREGRRRLTGADCTVWHGWPGV